MKTKALLVAAKGVAELGEVEVPDVGEGQIAIDTDWTGVSIGTERWIFLAEYIDTKFPLLPGYQRAGRVVEVGPGVTDFQVGDRAWCGGTLVAEGEKIERKFGGHCKRAVTAAAAAMKIPDGVSDEEAALAKMPAISRHGLEMTGVESGDLILLLGLGMIGNMAGQIARSRGCRVVALEPDPRRREMALGKAADVVADPGSTAFDGPLADEEKDAYDVLIDTTACEEAMNAAFFYVKRRGKVLLQGYYPGLTSLDLLYPHVRELTFYNPTNQQPEDLAAVFDLLAGKHIEIESLPERFRYEESAEVYGDLLCDPSRALTALIDWRDV